MTKSFDDIDGITADGIKRETFLNKLFHTYEFFGSAIIAIAGFLIFFPSFFSPVIFGDDWIWYVKLPLEESLDCPTQVPRMLLNCLPYLQYKLFGINFTAHRTITAFLAIFSGVAFYFLLNQLLPKRYLFNLVVSILFLFFPLDNYRQFTAISGYMNLAYIFYISSLALLLYFKNTQRWGAWFLAMIFVVISLSLYEAGVGLLLFSSFVLFLASLTLERKIKWAMLFPAILTVGYSIIRWEYQVNVGSTYGHATETLALDISNLIWRFYIAYRLAFHWSWVYPILHYFPGLVLPGEHTNLSVTLILIGLFLFYVVLLYFLAKQTFFKKANTGIELRYSENLHINDQNFIIFLIVGFVSVAPGLFPVILAVFPSGHFEASRIFTLPALGASLVMGIVLLFICQFISKGNGGRTLIFILLTAPFIILGICVKLTVQQNIEQAWIEQKSMWNQLFTLAPDIAEGTYLVMLIPKYDHLNVPPLQAGYDSFTFPLSLMYGGKHYTGVYLPTEITAFEYTDEGLIVDPINYKVVMPYEKVVIFQYDSTGKLSFINAIPSQTIDRFPQGKLLCTTCILSEPVPNADMRWLVHQ
jgi:hypothetical protein